jgi:hypothetical protein
MDVKIRETMNGSIRVIMLALSFLCCGFLSMAQADDLLFNPNQAYLKGVKGVFRKV